MAERRRRHGCSAAPAQLSPRRSRAIMSLWQASTAPLLPRRVRARWLRNAPGELSGRLSCSASLRCFVGPAAAVLRLLQDHLALAQAYGASTVHPRCRRNSMPLTLSLKSCRSNNECNAWNRRRSTWNSRQAAEGQSAYEAAEQLVRHVRGVTEATLNTGTRPAWQQLSSSFSAWSSASPGL